MLNPVFIVLLMNTVFASILAFSNIYINIFLWNQGRELGEIGLYNAFVFLFVFIGTLIGIQLMKWINSRFTFILSTLTLLSVFSFLIIEEQDVMQYVAVLGALYGSALGLYYAGFNLYPILLAKEENKQQLFIGMEEITNRLTSVVTPILFSYMILYFSYVETFRLIFAILFIQVIISLFTPKFKSNFSFSSLQYRFIWKKYRLVLLSIAAFGFFQSMIQITSSILLYRFVQNESFIGWFNGLFALLGIVTVYLISRSKGNNNRMATSLIGSIVGTLMILLLFFLQKDTIIAFNIVAAVVLPLILVPMTVTHYGKIQELSCDADFNCDVGLTTHYLLIREFFLAIGRTFFYMLLMGGLDFQGGGVNMIFLIFASTLPLTIHMFNISLFKEKIKDRN